MVTPNDNKSNSGNKGTLSLKSSNDASSTKQSASVKSFAVEIKKKKHGLNVRNSDSEHNTKNATKFASGSGNLTNTEFQARVLALQNAIKEEEEVAAKENIARQERLANPPVEEIVPPKDEILEKKLEVSPEVIKKNDVDEQPVKPVVFRQPFNKPNIEAKQNNIDSSAKNTTQDDADSFGKKKEKISIKAKQPVYKKVVDNRKISKATLNRVLNNDLEERVRSEASLKRARMKLRNVDKDQKIAKVVRDVNIPDRITVGELASRMAVQAAQLIKYLMKIGTLATVNQSLDGDTAEIICSEFGHIPKRISESDIENELIDIIEDQNDLSPRAPIVAVMGHVDHGKTTLLDTLRNANVAKKESGGITQHVASYQVLTKSGKKITFIDTPGHAAFSQIRSRGAVITDMIVLVVAADDGIKESTIEAINHAKNQDIPIIVAINKIDKPNINIDKVKTELMNHEIVLEDFGGDVLSVEISALKNLNLDKFLETILLQAEILELKANKNRKAMGTVLESRVDHGKGIVASVIVQYGTLKPGDIFVAGASFGKVRTIFNDAGVRIFEAEPSMPVDVVGFNSSPNPGDVLSVVDSEQKSREIAAYRSRNQRSNNLESVIQTVDQMISSQKIETSTLNIIVKADVSGSLEAIVAAIEYIQHSEIKVVVVEKSIGVIRESDIDFAKNTNAIVIGFNVTMANSAKELAKYNKVKVSHYSVIYHITEEVKKIMGTMLAPIVEENYIGTAEVRKIFEISRYGTIAGCCVIDGMMKRADSKIKVKRGDKYIFEGNIKSMKHEKDEIKTAKHHHECGILAEGYNDFKADDLIECYEIVLKTRSVS